MRETFSTLFDFKGASSRSEFFKTLVIIAGLYLILALIALFGFALMSLHLDALSAIVLLILAVLAPVLHFALAFALLALVIRRFRDGGMMKLTIVLLLLLSPIVAITVLALLPRSLLTYFQVVGRENIMLSTSLLLLYIFSLPILVVGFVPSKSHQRDH